MANLLLAEDDPRIASFVTKGLVAEGHVVDVAGTGLGAWEFCDRALDEAHVALTPGKDFGAHSGDTHVRLSYAASRTELQEGLERLGTFVESLR